MYKNALLLATFSLLALCVFAQPVQVGMTDTAAYFPALRGARVALLANHTSVAEFDGRAVHLADLLHDEGLNVTGIFAPEHGFRGTADAGEHVGNSVDKRTGIPILSLYNGNTQRPSDQAMRSFDVLVVDMQDVGLRFYTYYIAMIRMMDACADFQRKVIVLDRPNPNGHLIDGPLLDMKFRSGVGWLPMPVLHGLTMGEIALMSVGEGWSKMCDVKVVVCGNYTHSTPYVLPIAPSPNLTTPRSIALYASICLFEGTVVSVGRGTDKPFEIYGHPAMKGCAFKFTPRPTAGSKNPPFDGVQCAGYNLSTMPMDSVLNVGLDLNYLISTYRNLGLGNKFFLPMFEKLMGVDYVRKMVIAGSSNEEIRAVWQDDLDGYRKQRRNYLLYAE